MTTPQTPVAAPPVAATGTNSRRDPSTPTENTGSGPRPAGVGSPTREKQGEGLSTAGEPASLQRSGSCFASLWAAECHTCGVVLGRHRLISAAMRDLDWHREGHRMRTRESEHGNSLAVQTQRRADYYKLRDDGLSLDAAALAVGTHRGTASNWDTKRLEAGAA